MGMNIKSDEVHRLTAQLAELTGETLTSAVETAVRERLEREMRRDPQWRAELVRIARDIQQRLPATATSADHADLYDERGLPA